MTRTRIGVIVLCLVAAVTLSGAVSSATASDASIKKVIKAFGPRIELTEGHVISAIGEYRKTGNPRGVQSALTRASEVLSQLKAAIAKQSAGSQRVKAGKSKLERGLQSVISAYRKLRTAFGVKSVSRSAARAEAKKALLALASGNKQLREGILLLKK